ncbi:MAG: DUF4835 family protein [Prolixibacteraceae bacterium]|jgi:hypothetical protein|nr:DUF4835 family protein [Prolixibacteraceae bacterium]
MRRTLLSFILCLFLFQLSAQELQCNVSVSSSRIEGTYKEIFQTMRTDISEFMNTRKWTDNQFSFDERIVCTIFIQITDQIGSDEFKGTMQVQLNRPVFNSSYQTPILNIKDNDFDVRYVEFQPLEFSETSNTNALTNILAYYAYIILGFDYDTFSPMGGSPYFQRAKDIVNKSQNSREKGWRAFEGNNNRFWLVDNLTNKAYSPFRDLMYRYHRLGLDVMSEKPDLGRGEIADALKNMQKVYRARPDTYINRIFFDAKSDEIVNIFSKGSTDEKSRTMTILTECDPANSGKYEAIMQQKVF